MGQWKIYMWYVYDLIGVRRWIIVAYALLLSMDREFDRFHRYLCYRIWNFYDLLTNI